MSVDIDIAMLAGYQRLYIGFSGGLDSTVLLHHIATTPELKERITAIHINHQLQHHAHHWQQHCKAFCEKLGVHFISHNVTVSKHGSLEENAREARLQIFRQYVTGDDALILAHHHDDQAETLLLQLFRGAGLNGLAAIKPISTQGNMQVVRPLLAMSKRSLHQYATMHQLTWVEDDSNFDTSLRRNFIRHKIIPMLATVYPAINQTLSKNATLLNEQAQSLSLLLEPLVVEVCPDKTLCLIKLSHYSEPIQRSLFHFWLQKHHIKPCSYDKTTQIFREVIGANSDNCPHLVHDKCVITRFKSKLYIVDKHLYFMKVDGDFLWQDTLAPLKISPMNLSLSLALSRVEAIKATVSVRFRRGGETIRINGQTKRLKKLLQDKSIPPWQRKTQPLVYINNKLALVGNLFISDDFRKKYGQNYRLDWISC